MGFVVTKALPQLLKATSRSFYLTMRVLPAAIRPQISLAYLLARATDTIADTEIVSAEKRLEALGNLRARILGTSHRALEFGDLGAQQSLPAEKILLEKIEEALTSLAQFPQEDQQKIRDVLNVITSGQELDLRRFNSATKQNIIALQTEAELDDYTYRVAGCVGEFWTKMCRAHLFPHAKLDDEFFSRNGIRFGKGLQLVNILRDLPRDLRAGRCYLPQDELSRAGLTPGDLLEVSHGEKFRPVYQKYLGWAEEHLAAGWDYTQALPRSHVRVRLACAWPLLIGAKTLHALRGENILDASRRIKITRGEVRHLIAKSILFYPFSSAWDGQFFAASQ